MFRGYLTYVTSVLAAAGLIGRQRANKIKNKTFPPLPSHRIPNTTPMPNPLPRELLLSIATHLLDPKDSICFALAYRPFRHLYSSVYWSRLLVDQYFLRCRLYRDLPVIYHCRRCKGEGVPCKEHGLDAMMGGGKLVRGTTLTSW